MKLDQQIKDLEAKILRLKEELKKKYSIKQTIKKF